jgi:hypothetical protein
VRGELNVLPDDSQFPAPAFPASLLVQGNTNLQGDAAVIGNMTVGGNITVGGGGDVLQDYILSPNFNLALPINYGNILFPGSTVNDYGNFTTFLDFSDVGGAAFAAFLFQKTTIQVTASYLLASTDTNNNVISNFYFKGCTQADINAGFPFGTNSFRSLKQGLFLPPSIGDSFITGTQLCYMRQGTNYRATDTHLVIFYQNTAAGRTFAVCFNGNNTVNFLGMF